MYRSAPLPVLRLCITFNVNSMRSHEHAMFTFIHTHIQTLRILMSEETVWID